MSYQWQFNGAGVTGATGTSLTLTSVQPTNARQLHGGGDQHAGFGDQRGGGLTVLVPPAITAQPTNLTVVEGATASFSVIASGTSPLSYQWLFNGAGLGGATGTSLTLTSVQPTNGGQLHGGGDQSGGFCDQRGGGVDSAGAAGDHGPARPT